MARLFDDGDDEYLYINTPVVSTGPLTIAAWFNTDSLTANQAIAAICEDASWHSRVLYFRGGDAGDPVQAREFGGGGVLFAETTAGPGANAWHHGCAVFAAVNDRRAYLDGGNKGTDNGNQGAYPDCDNTTIGCYYANNAVQAPFSGAIDEVGIWNVALTDAEVAVLAAGYSPLFVRPQNLVAYWSLIRDEDQDRVGGYDLTAFNAPSIAPHSPVIYPAPLSFIMAPAAAPAVGQPMMLRATTVPGLRQWHPRV